MANAPGVAAGAAEQEVRGPAQLRAARGREMKDRVLADATLTDAFGSSTLQALNNSYSLSVAYAQVCASLR